MFSVAYRKIEKKEEGERRKEKVKISRFEEKGGLVEDGFKAFVNAGPQFDLLHREGILMQVGVRKIKDGDRNAVAVGGAPQGSQDRFPRNDLILCQADGRDPVTDPCEGPLPECLKPVHPQQRHE